MRIKTPQRLKASWLVALTFIEGFTEIHAIWLKQVKLAAILKRDAPSP